MKPTIVITSIFEPTEAVRKFSRLKDYDLIVVGDRKTPANWELEGVKFLSMEKQNQLNYGLHKLLPADHYCRKMMGYLYAMKSGTAMIIDTDDDNIPEPDWGFPAFTGKFPCTSENRGYVNAYSHYTSQKIWPRGFPLKHILSGSSMLKPDDFKTEQVRVGIWQALADGDPDVDAIYRLVSNKPCFFEKKEPVVLNEGTPCPFNSQNTAFSKPFFPLLYLPAFVSFRYTDILRGIVAQPVLWAAGSRLGFTTATVKQERNPHDYLKDFESEVPFYLQIEEVFDRVEKTVRPERTVPDNLYEAYSALEAKGLVQKEEMELLGLWLKDLP